MVTHRVVAVFQGKHPGRVQKPEHRSRQVDTWDQEQEQDQKGDSDESGEQQLFRSSISVGTSLVSTCFLPSPSCSGSRKVPLHLLRQQAIEGGSEQIRHQGEAVKDEDH